MFVVVVFDVSCVLLCLLLLCLWLLCLLLLVFSNNLNLMLIVFRNKLHKFHLNIETLISQPSRIAIS